MFKEIKCKTIVEYKPGLDLLIFEKNNVIEYEYVEHEPRVLSTWRYDKEGKVIDEKIITYD